MEYQKMIFEFETPGTFVEADPITKNIIFALVSQYEELNAAYFEFWNSLAQRHAIDAKRLWHERRDRVGVIAQELQSTSPTNALERNAAKIYAEAEIIYKREQWDKIGRPASFTERLPFIHAASFLYSTDQFSKLLGKLEEFNPKEERLKSLRKELSDFFPDLLEIRNSAHHMEDRILGIGRKGPIFKETDPPRQTAPILKLNTLNGGRFGTTLWNGEHGEIDISPESMINLRYILCGALGCFVWQGDARHYPSH